MVGPVVLRSLASAKVNLALAVTGVRADGYHELRSVFLRLELADTLSLTDSQAPDGPDQLHIEGDADCPLADNLVLRATMAFRAAAGGSPVPAVTFRLHKRIPMAAGLAGGSTDAASTLCLLAARFPDAAAAVDLRGLAAQIGSDVPFFVDGAGAGLVTGVGEAIDPLPPPIEPVGVLLVAPATGASTPRVFRAWDELSGDVRSSGNARRAVDELAHLLRSGVDPLTLAGHAAQLRAANDLWLPAAAVTPGLAALRDALERHLERPLLLTGSGSTLFALYPSAQAAIDVGRQLLTETSLPTTRVIATRSTGPHPQPITSDRRHP